ncbi:MAG: type II toxin-antitoxin system HicB family antitoxin [Chloroflexi bacterium]|nr:type II toxin-antitoxin system HicB family antitoxin [Chloroflexota bacterium]
MPCYSVYLESHPDGRTMAHVPMLPGCMCRKTNRDATLACLPDAIRGHHDWLRRHGKPTPADEPVEYVIAGESAGYGPFDPRNAAALFPPDLAPVTPDEMERCFRLMAHGRADLLALVADPSPGSELALSAVKGQVLPDDILDWQPDPTAWPLRRVLRHIGNAEEWYVSRLVPADTLPPEWKHDEEMPLFDFLAMERRTAIERLRQLTEAERAQVFYPEGWTDHPDEPWTAAKVLRRFLEHELEHTGQVREILAAWRARLLAWLAVERAGLLAQLTGLDEQILSEAPVVADWTAKDLLGHVAAWDEFFSGCMTLALAGREAEIGDVDVDSRNAALHAKRRDWPLAAALDAFSSARAEVLDVLARASDEALHRSLWLPWKSVGNRGSLRRMAQWRAWHDAEHAGQLAAWRSVQGATHRAGSKRVLQAALDSGRAALLSLADLIPPEERAAQPIVGAWTLKDVLGHLADWEWLSLDTARQMAAGKLPAVDYPADVDSWNQAHVAARHDQPWAVIWADLMAARQALTAFLAEASEAALNRPASSRWGPVDTAYNWVYACLDHDLEHVADLKAFMDLK